MTVIKKIIFAASLAVASFGFCFSSSAATIKHEILADGSAIGEVTVRLFENGATGQQDLVEFESFWFFDSSFVVTETFDFIATVDRDDVFAGIEFLAFDVDVDSIDLAFQGIFDADAADPAFDNFIDVFVISSGDVFGFAELGLGTAMVVSEPSALALFALALVGFGVRRKAK